MGELEPDTGLHGGPTVFLYPDLLTCLAAQFRAGRMLVGQAASLTGLSTSLTGQLQPCLTLQPGPSYTYQVLPHSIYYCTAQHKLKLRPALLLDRTPPTTHKYQPRP